VSQFIETETQTSKYHTRGGTGFSAEDANAHSDRLAGKRVEVTGRSNEVNGLDRIVDGQPFQTKYFDSASRTVGAAFGADGNYRYAGQRLEVPKDQYDSCVRIMRDRIAGGRVPGVSDPDLAETIVTSGRYTYQQARNIAQAGTVDSLWFDAQSMAVTCTAVMTVSAVIDLAIRCWRGQEVGAAASRAFVDATVAGTKTMIAGVATKQVLRTRLAAAGCQSSA